MKSVVNHAVYGEIVYEEGFWSGKRNLSVNGAELAKLSKRTFALAGGERIDVTGNYLTGVKMFIAGETIVLTPPPAWYEIVLSLLPFVLVLIWGNSVALCSVIPVIGGAIGGLVSGIFSITNIYIIKNVKSLWLKIVISIAAVAAAFLVCWGIGAAIIGSAS